MSSSTLTGSWDTLVAHSAALRAAVAAQDWMLASDVARQRHVSMVAHFQQFPVGPETAAFYGDHLAALLAEEPQLKALAVEARREVMKQGLAFNRSRRAATAYQGGDKGHRF